MKEQRSRGLMHFFNTLLLASFFFVSCAHKSEEKPKTLVATTIKGLFTGQDHYRGWVVYLSQDKVKTHQFPVKSNGSFKMTVPKLKQGNYQFHFGHKKSGFRSFQIPVYKPSINLGLVNTN
jgi:hypothetical protein